MFHGRLPYALSFGPFGMIRNNRNTLCFQQFTNLSVILHKPLQFVAEYWASRTCTPCTRTQAFASIKWETPPPGWIKLNSDGSCSTNRGIADAEGIIRDHLGNWIIGFTKNLGHGSNDEVEVWGLKTGLEIECCK
ncbi:hypothetical protein SLA2020_239980 [Shorea laevis]